jgi:pimeloyl-ACP methyl ester carboxylesterase
MMSASATAVAVPGNRGPSAGAPVVERARRFGDDDTLVGIVTEPPSGVPPQAAFILLNAGVVHRVGPNRMHVEIARGLAAAGFLAVRVDLSGLGDSESRRDNTPFERAAVLETQGVMSVLAAEYGVSRFVTAGLCSGAVVAFNTAVADQRVAGAVLINPQGFVSSQEWNAYVVGKAQARKYWRQKLLSARSWKKALTGKTQYKQLAGVMKQRAEALVTKNEAVAQVADGLAAQFARVQARGTRLLLACSEGDLGLEYLEAILGRGFTRRTNIETLMLPRGDHSLTMAVSRRRFQAGVETWARPLTTDSETADSAGAVR